MGRIIVIHYLRLNLQNFYLSHENNITAFEISKNNLIVSAEYDGSRGTIHIWDIHDKETLKIFDGAHRNPIQYLKFIENNSLLVSISKQKISYISIHDIIKGQILFSFSEKFLVNSLVTNFS